MKLSSNGKRGKRGHYWQPCAQHEELETRRLLAAYTVINALDAGAGSLRDAIVSANANPGADFIQFNIPGVGPHTIILQTPLPNLTDTITIDGTTQPEYAGTPVVEISGSQLTVGANGIDIRAPGFPSEMVDDEPPAPGYEVRWREG